MSLVARLGRQAFLVQLWNVKGAHYDLSPQHQYPNLLALELQLQSEKMAMEDNVEKMSVQSEQSSDTEGSSVELNLKEKEGGGKGWLTVLGSCLVYFSTFGIINSFGFFQKLYGETYLTSTPASTISFIGTIQILLMNLLAAPAGSLFDCYGLKVGFLLFPSETAPIHMSSINA
jgi:hypothetical protein